MKHLTVKERVERMRQKCENCMRGHSGCLWECAHRLVNAAVRQEHLKAVNRGRDRPGVYREARDETGLRRITMRRRRCETHQQLYSSICPQCENAKLRERIAALEKQIADVWGPSENVKIGYPADRVFTPLLNRLGVEGATGYKVSVDAFIESGPHTHMEATVYVMPRKLAQALADTWQELSRQSVRVARDAAERVSAQVAHAIREAHNCVVRLKLDEAVAHSATVTANSCLEFSKALEESLQHALQSE